MKKVIFMFAVLAAFVTADTFAQTYLPTSFLVKDVDDCGDMYAQLFAANDGNGQCSVDGSEVAANNPLPFITDAGITLNASSLSRTYAVRLKIWDGDDPASATLLFDYVICSPPASNSINRPFCGTGTVSYSYNSGVGEFDIDD